MDIYCNSANNRTDYALIEHGKRVFGCNNLGGWDDFKRAINDFMDDVKAIA